MSRITVTREIDAPIDRVFAVVTDIERLPENNEDVVRVEFLGEQRSGEGTRFRETRSMRGKEVTTELELTEWAENERARFVSDAGGTIWDTIFHFRPVGSGSRTEVRIELDARPYKLISRFVNPLIRGAVRRGMEKHVEAMKVHCESLD